MGAKNRGATRPGRAGRVLPNITAPQAEDAAEPVSFTPATELEQAVTGDADVKDAPTAGDDGEIKDAPTSTSRRSIRDIMYEMIPAKNEDGKDKYTTEEILEKIYEEFPNANSGPKDVSWYRWRLRKEGVLQGGKSRQSLTAEEKKARKAEYEKNYREKQRQEKEARRAEAGAQAAAARERDATARLLKVVEEQGMELTPEQVQALAHEAVAVAA